MKLIVVRHATAIDRGADISDEKRYLTPEGRLFFRKTARTMVQKGIDPGLILTSPLLRAVQTADILAESLAYKGPLVAVDELSPGFDQTGLEKLLDSCQQQGELVLVGHEPDLGSLVAGLLRLAHGFTFKKGSAVRLTVDPRNLRESATFKWLASGRNLVTSKEEAFG